MKFLHADKKNLTKTVYNIHGLDFSPEEIAKEIKSRIPEFEYKYEPDFRDKIAKSWPSSLDDSIARNDWGWNPKCKDVKSLVDTVLQNAKVSKY